MTVEPKAKDRHYLTIPSELWNQVIGYLEDKDIVNLKNTSQGFQNIAITTAWLNQANLGTLNFDTIRKSGLGCISNIKKLPPIRIISTSDRSIPLIFWRQAELQPRFVFPYASRDFQTISSHQENLLAIAKNERFSRYSLELSFLGSSSPSIILEDRERGSIESISISKNERFLATGSLDQTVKIWDLSSFSLLSTRQFPAKVFSLAFNRNATNIMISSGLKIHVCDIHSISNKVFCENHSLMTKIASHPRLNEIVTASEDGLIDIWDESNYTCRLSISAHTTEINHLKITPDGKKIISGAHDKIVKIWDSISGNLLVKIPNFASENGSISICPTSEKIAITDLSGKIYIYSFTPAIEDFLFSILDMVDSREPPDATLSKLVFRLLPTNLKVHLERKSLQEIEEIAFQRFSRNHTRNIKLLKTFPPNYFRFEDYIRQAFELIKTYPKKYHSKLEELLNAAL